MKRCLLLVALAIAVSSMAGCIPPPGPGGGGQRHGGSDQHRGGDRNQPPCDRNRDRNCRDDGRGGRR